MTAYIQLNDSDDLKKVGLSVSKYYDILLCSCPFIDRYIKTIGSLLSASPIL